ncbi:MAG: D-alanyl-D-alanine carboxypeptidase [Patulibacter sp.]|nr:D-alanyl-D-alanine carboxypeptidase [Patulibacter sp.]
MRHTVRQRWSTLAVLAALALLGGTGATGATAAMPSTSGIGPRSGVVVADATTGKLLLSRAANHPRIPASVTKLFTVAAALRRFGPDWTPQTRVVATGEAAGRTWNGNLYLVGGGDPALTASGLRQLARSTAKQLDVSRVRGKLLVDAGAFDSWRGADRTRRATDPDMGGVLGALTVDRGRSGTNPATTAGTTFRTALRRAGVTVPGSVRLGNAPEAATPVATLVGPDVRTLAARILQPSDNFASEVLMKGLVSADGTEGACRQRAGLAVVRDWRLPPTDEDEPCVAQRASVPATTTAGSRALRTILKPVLGVTPQIHDGSGLTRRNRVSPALVTRLLVQLHNDPALSPVVHAALPRAGASGTLARRMRGTAAQGRCRAKTGTINGVSALAGYCTTVSGRELAFAILQNGSSPWSARAFQDRFVAQLARS